MLTGMLTILCTGVKSLSNALAGGSRYAQVCPDMTPRQRDIRNIGVTVLSDPGWDMRGRMRSFRLGSTRLLAQTSRRNPRPSRVAFGLTAVTAAMLLAACSSSSSSSSSSGSANVSALANAVDQAAAEPSFSTYAANYGEKIPSISNLAGKKIMIIPGVSALAACTEIAQADAAIATAAGMKPTIFENQGSTAEHNTAIENAIHQGYAAIDMGCAMDPSTSAPAIAQALKAGIVVESYGATPQEAADAKITYNNVDPYALDAKLAFDQAVAQHNGQPFHAIAITSNATGPATAFMEASLKSELA